jgi:5-methylcytosine-specific restriction endonuclease McrA
MKRRRLTRLERYIVFRANNGRCAICGDELDFKHFEIDHIIPFSITHWTFLAELQPTCRKCNRAKGNRLHV